MIDCLIGQTLRASKLQCNFTPKLHWPISLSRCNDSWTCVPFLPLLLGYRRKDAAKGVKRTILPRKIVIFTTACFKAARKKSVIHFNLDVQFLWIDTSAKGLLHVCSYTHPSVLLSAYYSTYLSECLPSHSSVCLSILLYLPLWAQGPRRGRCW